MADRDGIINEPDDEKWFQQMCELANQSGALGISRNPKIMRRFMTINVKIIEDKANWDFGSWFPLEKQHIAVSHEGASPDFPGIYDIGLTTPVPYLNGESQIFYIGRGGAQKEGDRGTISKSLERHIKNGCGAEKWLRLQRPDQQILARFAIAKDGKQANTWEKLRLRWFVEQFWSLPTGNLRAEGIPTEPMHAFDLIKKIHEEWGVPLKGY